MSRIRSTRCHDKCANPNAWWVAISLLMLGMTLASCQAAPSTDDALADHSFLTQQPCASPCWYGLEPDKSTSSEVYSALGKLPFIDSTSITTWGYIWLNDDSAQQIGFSCSHPKDEECGGSAIISQDKLKRLDFSSPHELTFKKAVSILAQPDYMDYRPLNPEGTGCVITLIWSKKGVYLTSIDLKNEEPCRKIRVTGHVDPDIVVTQIYYVTRDVLAPGSKGYFANSIPWAGFAQP